MVRFEISGVTFEVSEGSVLAEVLSVAVEVIKHIDYMLSTGKNDDKWDYMPLSKLVDKTFDMKEYKPYHDFIYKLYKREIAVSDDIYFDENIEAFRELQSHYGEPNFDYGFYSDWHKDLFGYRP